MNKQRIKLIESNLCRRNNGKQQIISKAPIRESLNPLLWIPLHEIDLVLLCTPAISSIQFHSTATLHLHPRLFPIATQVYEDMVQHACNWSVHGRIHLFVQLHCNAALESRSAADIEEPIELHSIWFLSLPTYLYKTKVKTDNNLHTANGVKCLLLNVRKYFNWAEIWISD